VRLPVVQVPQPIGARPATASAETGSASSDRARIRKYCSWSDAASASRMAASASVAGSHSLNGHPFPSRRPATTTYKAAPAGHHTGRYGSSIAGSCSH
jgi:hypothetical protein